MILDAIDLNEYRETEKEVQLWKTTVTSTGTSGDLRQVFPILVAASQEHIHNNGLEAGSQGCPETASGRQVAVACAA